MKFNKRAAVVPFFTPYIALFVGVIFAIGMLIYGVWIDNPEDIEPPVVDSTTQENVNEETVPEFDMEVSVPDSSMETNPSIEEDDVSSDDVVVEDSENSSVNPDNDLSVDEVPDEPMDDVLEEDNIQEDNSEVEVVIPDILTLNVKLYNNHKEGYNMVDGREYLEDIVSYLKMYAPEDLLISAAATMSYTEGGSGKKGVYAYTNNCFGIRAYSSWEGYVFARSTGLVYKDYQTAINAGASDFFRAYDSMEDSVKDYIKLMCGNYYKDVLKVETPAEYFAFVLSKGYGEAELYDMWLSVLNLYEIDKWV